MCQYDIATVLKNVHSFLEGDYETCSRLYSFGWDNIAIRLFLFRIAVRTEWSRRQGRGRGDPCKSGGKCEAFCQNLDKAIDDPCLKSTFREFSDLMQKNAIQDVGSLKGNWCPSEPAADPKTVAKALVAGVAMGESSCSETAEGSFKGVNGEHPVGACQLNKTSVQPYSCCKGVTQEQLESDGLVEAKCGLGVTLDNVVKDRIWAAGETSKGDAKGAAKFNQSCANSRPQLKELAENATRAACQAGGQSGGRQGPSTTTR